MQVSSINLSNNYINNLPVAYGVQVQAPQASRTASLECEGQLEKLLELGLCKNYNLNSSIVFDGRFNKLSADWIKNYATERLNAKLSFCLGREVSVGQLFSKLYQFAQQKGIPFEAIQIVGDHPISSVNLTWVRDLFLEAALIHPSADEIYSPTLCENLKKAAHNIEYNLSTSVDASWEQVQDLYDFFLAELATLNPAYDVLSMEERAFELQESEFLGNLWENSQAQKGFILAAVNAVSEGQIGTNFNIGNRFSYTFFSGKNFKVCIVPGSIHLLADGTVDKSKLEVHVESHGCNVLKALFDRGYNLIADYPNSIFDEEAFIAFLEEIARGGQCCDSQLFQKVIQALIQGPSSLPTLGSRMNRGLIKAIEKVGYYNIEGMNGMLTALALMLEIGITQKQEHKSSPIVRRQLNKMWDTIYPRPSAVATLRSHYRIPAHFLTIPWLLGGLMRLGQANSTDSRIFLTNFEEHVALRFKLQNFPEGFAQYKLNAFEIVTTLAVSFNYYIPTPALDLLLKGGLDLLDLNAPFSLQKSILSLDKNKHIWEGFVKEQVEEFLLAEHHPYYNFAGTALLYAAWKATDESSIARYLLKKAVPQLYSSGHPELYRLATNLSAELEYFLKEPAQSILQSVEVEKENAKEENSLILLVKDNEFSQEKIRVEIAPLFAKERLARVEFVSLLELFYILPEDGKALRIDLAKVLLKRLCESNYKIPLKEKLKAFEAFISLLSPSEEASFAILSLKKPAADLKRLLVKYLDAIMNPITEYSAEVVRFLTDLQPFMSLEERGLYAHKLLKNPEICPQSTLLKWAASLPSDLLSKEERAEVVSCVEKMPDSVGFNAVLVETLQGPQEDELSDTLLECIHWADLEPAATAEESARFWDIAQNTLSETLAQKQFWKDFQKLRGKLLPEHVALLDSTYLEAFFGRASKWMKSLILQKVAKWENLSKEIRNTLEAEDPLTDQDILGNNCIALRRLYNLCKRKNNTLDTGIWIAVLLRISILEQPDHWSKLTYNLWKKSLDKFSDTLNTYSDHFSLILHCAMRFEDQTFLKESYSHLSRIVPHLSSQIELYQNYIIYGLQNSVSKKNCQRLISSYKQLALTPEKTQLLVEKGVPKLLTLMEQMERKRICVALFEQLLAVLEGADGGFDFNDSCTVSLFQVFASHISYWSPEDISVLGRKRLLTFVYDSLKVNQQLTWDESFKTPEAIVNRLLWLHKVKSLSPTCQDTLKNVTVLYFNCLNFSMSSGGRLLQDVAERCSKEVFKKRLDTLATDIGHTLADNYIKNYVNPIGLIKLLQHPSASLWFLNGVQKMLVSMVIDYNKYLKCEIDYKGTLTDSFREDFEGMGLSKTVITSILPAFKQAFDTNKTIVKKRLTWVMDRVKQSSKMEEIRTIAEMEVSPEERSTKIIQKLKEQLMQEHLEIHKLFLEQCEGSRDINDISKLFDLLVDSIWELFMVFGDYKFFLREAKEALQRVYTISEKTKDTSYTALSLRFQNKFIKNIGIFKNTKLSHKIAFATSWCVLLEEFAQHILTKKHVETKIMQANITAMLKQLVGVIRFSKEDSDPAFFAAMKEQLLAFYNKITADAKFAAFAELATIDQLLQ